jgi:hypothetical protein
MNFEDYLTEAKSPLIDGVTLTKKASTASFYHKGENTKTKQFDVHLHGHHIGQVETYPAQEHSKIKGSRLVKPKAPRIAWKANTSSEIEKKHGADYYRSSASMGAYDAHQAANSLARHYAPHIKKAE